MDKDHSNTEVGGTPAWWLNFLTAVIKNLPQPGEIDQATAERWEKEDSSGLKKALAYALLPTLKKPKKTVEKFFYVKTIQVTVPDDYDHATQLATFREKNYEKFHEYNNQITDENFAKVTTKLVPGRKYAVKIFGINPGEIAGSDECLAKYREEKALFVGAQGASVVWQENRKDLPKDKWYVSFDEKKALYKVTYDRLRVPRVGA